MDMVAHSDPLLAGAERLGRHPAFPAAVRTYCVELARLRESPRLLNAIVATEARWRIIGYLLYLADDTERFGPLGGATYGRLLHVCTLRQEAGSRVLKTLLGLLKLSSLVRLVPDPQDGRIHYYQPTERMNAFVRGWMNYAVSALDLLDPDGDRQRFIDDPRFLARFNVSGGRAHLADTVPLVDRLPEPLATLNTRLGSFSVLVGVMEAALCDRPPPSAAGLAWRFGLSRGQVRNVVGAGQMLGLFEAGSAGAIRPTALLHDRFAAWVAIELSFYALHMGPPDAPVLPVRDEIF